MRQERVYIQPQELLHQAILEDSAEGIREAVQVGGADVNQEREGKKPILWAILLKKSTAVDGLLECGVKGDKMLAEFSIKLGNLAPVISFLRNRDIEKNLVFKVYKTGCGILSENLIQAALKLGEIRHAITFLRMGAPFRKDMAVVSWIFNLLFHPYFENGQITLELILELIQEFINHGYNINHIWHWDVHRGTTPVLMKYHSWIYENKEILRLCIRNGADVNHKIFFRGSRTKFFTPLSRAIEFGDFEAVEIILNAGADPNQKTNLLSGVNIQTPLAFAIELGKSEMVELLLERGAPL